MIGEEQYDVGNMDQLLEQNPVAVYKALKNVASVGANK